MSKRCDYTHDERVEILRFIIEHEAYHILRGNSIWKQLEKSEKLDRTWQSMKQHFKMKIVEQLNRYEIPKEEQEKIRNGYNNTRLQKSTGDNKKVRIPASKSLLLDFSDDEAPNDKENNTKKYKRIRETRASSTSSSSSLDLGKTPENNKKNGKKVRSESPPMKELQKESPKRNLKQFKKQVLTYKMKETPLKQTKNKKPEEPAIDQNATTIELDNNPIIIDSDDDETFVASLEGSNSTPSPVVSSAGISSSSKIFNEIEELKPFEDFSLEEDLALINYFKKDSEFLKFINESVMYKLYIETREIKNRSWRELRDRFTKDVLPNLHTYNCLTTEEVMKIYNLVGIKIPVELQPTTSQIVDLIEEWNDVDETVEILSNSDDEVIIEPQPASTNTNEILEQKSQTSTNKTLEKQETCTNSNANKTLEKEQIDACVQTDVDIELNDYTTITRDVSAENVHFVQENELAELKEIHNLQENVAKGLKTSLNRFVNDGFPFSEQQTELKIREITEYLEKEDDDAKEEETVEDEEFCTCNVKQEFDVDEVQIKSENFEDEDTILVELNPLELGETEIQQPEIKINLSGFFETQNQTSETIISSQHFETISTQDLNIVEIVSKLNNGNQIEQFHATTSSTGSQIFHSCYESFNFNPN